MEVALTAALAALIGKITSVVKYISAGDYRPAVTQVLVWAIGVGTVMLTAQSDLAETFNTVGGQVLAELDTWSQVLGGIALGSGISVVRDGIKAVSSDTPVAEPPLGGGAAPQ